MCTIGDAYLAVNEPKTQHDDQIMGALVLLHLAMAMLRIIVQVRDEVDHQGEAGVAFTIYIYMQAVLQACYFLLLLVLYLARFCCIFYIL